jgi:hypothetical protein
MPRLRTKDDTNINGCIIALKKELRAIIDNDTFDL